MGHQARSAMSRACEHGWGMWRACQQIRSDLVMPLSMSYPFHHHDTLGLPDAPEAASASVGRALKPAWALAALHKSASDQLRAILCRDPLMRPSSMLSLEMCLTRGKPCCEPAFC